jgi:phage recombination protein Bet
MTLTTTDHIDSNIELLRNTLCKGISPEQFEIFVQVCKRTGLDPFRNQIYAVPRAGKMTIQTGIDGFRLVAERTGKYSPGREPVFTYKDENMKQVHSATSYIKKQTADGSWHEVAATAFWDEYVQAYNGKPSQFWAKMPHVMISKCAEALALRKAFPADFSGIYSTEEMQQAEAEVVSIPQEPVEVLTQKDVEDFAAKNFEHLQKEFLEFSGILKNSKQWTYDILVQELQKDLDKTRKTFVQWCEKRLREKSGLEEKKDA